LSQAIKQFAGLSLIFISCVTYNAGVFAQGCPPAASWCSGTYAYDAMGNIRAIGADTYIYDTAGRLVSGTADVNRTGILSRQDYSYDAFGNRTGASRIAGSVDCLGGCELSPAIDPATNHITSNGTQYDAAGNLIFIQGPNNTTYTYTYDAAGSLVHAVAGTDDRQFIYTADDERIATANGATWTWAVRGLDGKVLREFTSLQPQGGLPTSNWQWSRDYIWRDVLLLATVAPTTPGASTTVTQHYHLDHLGTPRMVTGDNGVQLGVHAYYPFGAELNLTPTEQPAELMKFTGHERDLLANDPHTLDYMHARYEMGTMGRFLSVDPIFGKPYEPQSWNRYAYVLNNPLRYTDPDGREHVKEPGFTQPLSEADWSDAPLVIKAAFYAEGVLVSEAAAEFLGGWFTTSATVTRYMGNEEAEVARRTGNVPNVGRNANPRPTHITTDKPLNSSTEAQGKYELPETPTHRATVPKDRVPGGLSPTPDGRPTTSGGGSQSATNQPIPVKPSEIKPLDRSWVDRVVSWFK
jgi:RHS repeat-associated protein